MCKLGSDGKVTIEEGFAYATASEIDLLRTSLRHDALLTELKTEAKEPKTFCDKKCIVISKAQKTNTFIKINCEDYKTRLGAILSDGTKFII